MCLLTVSMSSLEKCHVLYFFNWIFKNILSCMSFLYVLVVNPLLDVSFANVFSHSVDCLFVSLIVSFAV